MTAATSERLAQALEAVKLTEMAAKARADHYHDFLSDIGLPEMALEEDLIRARDSCPDIERAAKIELIRMAHHQGEWDASAQESEAWARSEDGIDTFRRLIKGE